MPESIENMFQRASNAPPAVVFLRLVIALALGWLVAWVYKRTTRDGEGSAFPVTLTLLTVLIAMVTQVIGDNVARAFSLVGALSIVRFRTVVRDTRDTAFVIFAVVTGMAVGSANLATAIIGLVVVAAGAFLLARNKESFVEEAQPPLILSLRVGIGHDLDQLLGGALNAYLADRKLMSVNTAKQGISLQVMYEARLRPEASAVELVSALNQIDGVQDVRMQRKGFEPE